MDTLLQLVQTANAYLSDYILIVMLVGCGLYYSIRTRFVQVRCLGEGMRRVFGGFSLRGGKQSGGMSSFQALATAVAAQVGTGQHRRAPAAPSWWVALASCSGCGSSRSSAWPPSTPKRSWPRKPVW